MIRALFKYKRANVTMFVIESEQDGKVFSLFLLAGSSDAFQNKLTQLGGTFRSNLRCKGGQLRDGWLFSIDKKEQVQKFIDSNEESELLIDSEDEQNMKVDELSDVVMDLIARVEALERSAKRCMGIFPRLKALEERGRR